MKKYVHWLKIDGFAFGKDFAEQFLEIENYLKKYPTSKATVFWYDSGSMHRIVKLECEQCYRDLDMCVNSSSTYLLRLHSKPKNIGREHDFCFPDVYRKYLVA